MQQHADQYIGGAWRPTLGGGGLEVVDPATEQVLATVAAGTAEDVDAAVRAARGAARAWGATGRAERLAPLTRLLGGR
ncbi:aldehyde dehydrogenase family protein, partial [Kitasatospora nipponensis]|uniref:aldehyde dehydrogenase family protein n=1 Tax=Kitasatospora nipponensis TaxID=258049 RepID=UPI0031CF2CAD